MRGIGRTENCWELRKTASHNLGPWFSMLQVGKMKSDRFANLKNGAGSKWTEEWSDWQRSMNIALGGDRHSFNASTSNLQVGQSENCRFFKASHDTTVDHLLLNISFYKKSGRRRVEYLDWRQDTLFSKAGLGYDTALRWVRAHSEQFNTTRCYINKNQCSITSHNSIPLLKVILLMGWPSRLPWIFPDH